MLPLDPAQHQHRLRRHALLPVEENDDDEAGETQPLGPGTTSATGFPYFHVRGSAAQLQLTLPGPGAA